MKTGIIRFFALSLLIIGVTSCGNNLGTNYTQNDKELIPNIVQMEGEDGMLTFTDVCSDLQLIPLENNRQGMLSNVNKMRIDGDRLFVLDKSSEPRVLEFDLDGRFITHIGGMGASKSEFQFVDDIAVDPYTKRVLVLYYNKIKIYDYAGKFLKDVDLGETDVYNYNIESVKNGYVMSTRYQGYEYLVQLYDKDFNVIKRLVNVGGKQIKDISTFNPLSYDGENVCFYDFYESKYYIFNPEASDSVSCYSVKDDNLRTYEKLLNDVNNNQTSEYNGPLGCFYAKDKAYGLYIKDNSCLSYIFDFKDKTYDVYYNNGWFPTIRDYNDGYYYTILSAEDVMNIVKVYPGLSPQSYQQVFMNEIEKFKEPLKMESNYVLVRMKFKDK